MKDSIFFSVAMLSCYVYARGMTIIPRKVNKINVATLFNDDIRNKKRIGANIHKAKGKRGYVGKMVTTLDLLSGKEKRQYKKSGKVKVQNVYKQLLPLEELQTYTPDKQKQIMEKWREEHNNPEIMKALKITKTEYYSLLDKLEIKKKNTGNRHSTINHYANKEIDVVDYKYFRTLKEEYKYYLLDYYLRTIGANKLSKEWNKKTSTLHQYKYTLKKKLEKNGLYEQAVSNIENDQVPYDYILSSWEPKPKFKPKQEKFVAIESEKPKKEKAEENIKYLQPEAEPKKESGSGIREEDFKQLTNVIDKLVNTVETNQKNIKELVSTDAKEVNYIREEKVQEEKSQGMNLNYNDSKEGFLIHQEIQHLLNVLEKNPGSFEVNLSIKKL